MPVAYIIIACTVIINRNDMQVCMACNTAGMKHVSIRTSHKSMLPVLFGNILTIIFLKWIDSINDVVLWSSKFKKRVLN